MYATFFFIHIQKFTRTVFFSSNGGHPKNGSNTTTENGSNIYFLN